jgi:tetrahydromethanopterin S-methyltransferase subunit G
MQGDPTTCQFILSEEQYEGTYGRVNTPAVMPDYCSGDEVDDLDELKQAMDEVKVRVDSVVTELCQLKVQVQKMKMTAICVVVGCGCVTTAICGVAIGLVTSKMW